MKKNEIGFTLVEMLVVIAIIGILSSVAVVNLNSARNKSKMAAIKTQLNSVIPLVQLCYSFDKPLLYDGESPCNDSNKIVSNEKVCEGVTDLWPMLEHGYEYGTCTTNTEEYSFSFFADPPAGDGGVRTISCGDDTLGCQEVN